MPIIPEPIMAFARLTEAPTFPDFFFGSGMLERRRFGCEGWEAMVVVKNISVERAYKLMFPLVVQYGYCEDVTLLDADASLCLSSNYFNFVASSHPAKN
jgi:hypothetical protein